MTKPLVAVGRRLLAGLVCIGLLVACTTDPAPDPSIGPELSWERSTLESDLAVFDLVAGGGGLIGVCSQGIEMRICRSEDGLSWSTSRLPVRDGRTGSPMAIDRTTAGYVVAGQRREDDAKGVQSTPGIWRSADGGSWLESSVRVEVPIALNAVAMGQGQVVVAVGSLTDSTGGYAAYYTLYGDERASASTLPESEGGSAADVAAGEAGFVAVGSLPPLQSADGMSRGAVWTSNDGQSWEFVDDPETFRDASLEAVVATDHGYVAVGWRMDGEAGLVPTAWISADGRSWSRDGGMEPGLPSPPPDARAFVGAMFEDVAIAWDGRLVGVGVAILPSDDLVRVEPMIATSVDGVAWTRIVDPELLPGGESSGIEFGISTVAAWGKRVIAIGTSLEGRSAWLTQPR